MNKGFTLRVTALLIAMCCIIKIPSASGAQGFKVEGTVRRVVLEPKTGAEKITPKTTRFSVTVRDCEWLIRTINDGSISDYTEAGTDGTNTYVLTSLLGAVEKQMALGKPLGSNIATAYVVPGTIPPNYLDRVLPTVWLAFASSCVLDTITNHELPALEAAQTLSPDLLASTMTASYQRLTIAPFLPKNISYFNEGTKSYWEDAEYGPWTHPPEVIPYASPYDQGFTNRVYSVSVTTNVGGLAIPCISTLCTYVPTHGGTNSSDLALKSSHEIRVTNVMLNTIPTALVPKVPGRTAVSDYRFCFESPPVLGAIRYSCYSNWLSNYEVTQLTNFQSQVDANKQLYQGIAVATELKQTSLSASSKIVWSVLVILLALPAFFVFRSTSSKSKRF